jgi:hypothetical protein
MQGDTQEKRMARARRQTGVKAETKVHQPLRPGQAHRKPPTEMQQMMLKLQLNQNQSGPVS